MIEHLLDGQLAAWRPTSVEDAGGGRTITWVQLGEYPVRISQPTGADDVVALQDLGRLTHQAYTTVGQDLDRGDELRGPHPVTGQHIVLRVLRIVVPSEPAYLRADCEERQAEGPE